MFLERSDLKRSLTAYSDNGAYYQRAEKRVFIGFSQDKQLFLVEPRRWELAPPIALEAGYAKSVARNAKDRIETADVHAAFARLIQEGVPADTLVRLLRDGLDAMETRVFTFRGKVRDTLQVINFAERRAYIELVMEYGGYRRST